jgi:hypothetical protein
MESSNKEEATSKAHLEEEKETRPLLEEIKTSSLITSTTDEDKDPIHFCERELRVRLTADRRDEIRKQIEEEGTYKEKVKKVLEILRVDFKDNHKTMKEIDKLEPLYDAHDFWDSQPVPKAYETVDAS